MSFLVECFLLASVVDVGLLGVVYLLSIGVGCALDDPLFLSVGVDVS